eukprot:COSAG02_NODE_3145_length_7289_cov_10.121280_4_plen_178_part_00
MHFIVQCVFNTLNESNPACDRGTLMHEQNGADFCIEYRSGACRAFRNSYRIPVPVLRIHRYMHGTTNLILTSYMACKILEGRRDFRLRLAGISAQGTRSDPPAERTHIYCATPASARPAQTDLASLSAREHQQPVVVVGRQESSVPGIRTKCAVSCELPGRFGAAGGWSELNAAGAG